ncbi:class I SAM-dependent methyltransferase [Peribacillus huizhouensis]|uniref:Methyltransferase n=1 Tax=Peribacillus huizhouensis TaxID=1501239 RepID=A0ABR6CSZ7_9BACI|nr:class I SAM-dependent methyltransferase [Peribacillus huizhouensis]MBA9027720.1 putative methyltransferase [Peribacillus huizhouensis]
MFVTTAGRTDEIHTERAKSIATQFSLPFYKRNKRSLTRMHQDYGMDCLVVGKNKLELHTISGGSPFFFHPNIAMVRIKRMMNGEDDPYITAARIEKGSSILDCTLGLGSDAIIASYVSGACGEIRAIEENSIISFIVKEGLLQWESGIELMDAAMKRIQIETGNHHEVLKKLPDNSFDVVYFDPMFEERIEESEGINGLAQFASYNDLQLETIEQAKRVANNRVVLKDHFRSKRFEKLGFTTIKRKTSLFHYGYIQL